LSTSHLHTHAELAALLSQNLGMEKALDLVGNAARELSFGSELSMEQGLEVLERIAVQPGLVGIAARFAKSRVLLRWGNAAS
jgi:hypothetical protein